jgi:hypothetical protein
MIVEASQQLYEAAHLLFKSTGRSHGQPFVGETALPSRSPGRFPERGVNLGDARSVYNPRDISHSDPAPGHDWNAIACTTHKHCKSVGLSLRTGPASGGQDALRARQNDVFQ